MPVRGVPTRSWRPPNLIVRCLPGHATYGFETELKPDLTTQEFLAAIQGLNDRQ
jgi:hypothetical protein